MKEKNDRRQTNHLVLINVTGSGNPKFTLSKHYRNTKEKAVSLPVFQNKYVCPWVHVHVLVGGVGVCVRVCD